LFFPSTQIIAIITRHSTVGVITNTAGRNAIGTAVATGPIISRGIVFTGVLAAIRSIAGTTDRQIAALRRSYRIVIFPNPALADKKADYFIFRIAFVPSMMIADISGAHF
jgi:hypothetical protein